MEDYFCGGLGFEVVEGGHFARRGWWCRKEGRWGLRSKCIRKKVRFRKRLGGRFVFHSICLNHTLDSITMTNIALERSAHDNPRFDVTSPSISSSLEADF